MDEKFVETLTLRLRTSSGERERERESARERGREGRQGGGRGESPGRARVRNCGIFGGELCNREVVSTLVVIGELENYGESELNLEHRLLVLLGGLFFSWREMWSYGSSVSSQWRYSLGSWCTRYTYLCFCLIPSQISGSFVFWACCRGFFFLAHSFLSIISLKLKWNFP